ncbi:hypothetical protein G3580_10405 [Nitrogeniibacter mangrovi]|uniref:Uncharacterized protein n=1 Tax=Nitrogeniibacter mangrovi TaxID=2016596 RepID=A0A6C1B382_9RHOO|nr:hypothetical protein [Nitrogeniibacter mangrovi]QID18017.1 hypothetical protein G3580_10405 [Nitrogeniibacter mangrovi]
MLAYAKAEKGLAEIETRAFGLSPKLRRVLILIDGQRTLESLKSMLGFDELEKMLDELTHQGFIEAVASGHDGGGEAADVAADPDAALANLPESRPAGDLDKAKNFIINTLVHFHGQYTKLDLMRAVKACDSHGALRALYADWVRCMHESRQAEKRLPELTEQLLAVI